MVVRPKSASGFLSLEKDDENERELCSDHFHFPVFVVSKLVSVPLQLFTPPKGLPLSACLLYLQSLRIYRSRGRFYTFSPQTLGRLAER